ncbi:MAG: hypothetical protein EF812_06360 [Methanosarcinales archaeon]|nr:MAG: hypothetical protein EF812_06360 [Methanosarcinales archaeon]
MYMKTLLYFLLIVICINIATAYDEDDLEWACGNSKELHLGETISNGNYTVEAYNFPRSDRNETRFVGIRLYKDCVLVSDQTLVERENYIYDDEIRVTILEFSTQPSRWTTDIPEERWAKIKMEPIGMPRFDVEFETGKDDYSAYSAPIEVDLVLQNTGDSKAHNVDVDVDAEGLEVIGGKAYHHCNNLKRGERLDGKTDTPALDPITLRLGVPSVIEDTLFNITVNIECCDIRGVKYSYSDSYPVKVSGMFKISKSINDNIYINEIATVTITLRNDGTRSIDSIKLSDTLPPYFELNDNSTLQWELNLGDGKCRSFAYQLKPMQPNKAGYVIPAAIAEWTDDGRTYSARSNSPGIAVYGPKIELSKTVNPSTGDEDGIVTVTIEVKNTGNVLASVDVADYLPKTAVLTDGVTSDEMILEAGETQRFSYSMKINTAGYIELPPAVVHFVDTHDCRGTVISEEISITVNPVNQHAARTVNTPDQTITPMATVNTIIKTDKESGVGSVCALIGFLAAVFVIKGCLMRFISSQTSSNFLFEDKK